MPMILAEIPNEITPLRVALYTVNMAIVVAALVVALVFLRALHATPTLHRNVRVTFASLTVGGIIICCTRFVLVPFMMTGQRWPRPDEKLYIWLCGFCHDVSRLQEDAVFWALIVERAASTVYSRSYETSFNANFTALLVILPWIYAIGEGLIMFTGIVKQLNLWIVNSAFTFVSCIAFAVLNHLNNVKYWRRVGDLSERYQVTENMKTAAAVYRYMQLILLRHATLFSMQMFVSLVTAANHLDYETRVAFNVYDLIIVLFNLIAPLLIARAHPQLQARMREEFWALVALRVLSPQIGADTASVFSVTEKRNDIDPAAAATTTAPATVVRDINGEVLLSSPDTDRHFAMLAQLWSAPKSDGAKEWKESFGKNIQRQGRVQRNES